MNPKVKLGAYAVLLILVAWFGLDFRYNYDAATSEPVTESADAIPDAPVPPEGTNTEAAPAPSTNAVTNIVAQTTNAAGEVTNVTNAAPAEVTNSASAGTNIAAAAPAPKHHKKHRAKPTAQEASSAKGAMVSYLAGLIAALIGLGLMVANDLTHYVGSRATDYLFMDVGDAMRDPIYERAEAEWANGTYLEAIQLLRDYLKRNPREIHAALRIAEIYEKDLKNDLAAALEYEEVLKQKLPDERWGWAAIHLCNLYSRLNHHDKTRDLLHRIANEYPRTGAAKKARVRLGLQELEDETATEQAVETAEGTTTTVRPPGAIDDEPETPPPSEPPKPSLPPGFRPKK
jgi:TolA-binding protein